LRKEKEGEAMSDITPVQITDANFESEVLRSPLPVLLDFTSTWCSPCRTIAPHVHALAQTYRGRARVGTCDVDANPATAQALEIRGMPTLLMFKGGQVVGQIVGAVPRAKIEALMAKALA
jgi:thioredoxin 1